jgi:hypothetical protein
MHGLVDYFNFNDFTAYVQRKIRKEKIEKIGKT